MRCRFCSLQSDSELFAALLRGIKIRAGEKPHGVVGSIKLCQFPGDYPNAFSRSADFEGNRIKIYIYVHRTGIPSTLHSDLVVSFLIFLFDISRRTSENALCFSRHKSKTKNANDHALDALTMKNIGSRCSSNWDVTANFHLKLELT